MAKLSGWKGQDEMIITMHGNDYKIVEHRKTKETGEIQTSEKIIPRQNVRDLYDLIKQHCTKDIKYDYKFIVEKIIIHYGFHTNENCALSMMMNMFNGGKYRAKYYFPYYYYPMKILEAAKKIDYLGRGGLIYRR